MKKSAVVCCCHQFPPLISLSVVGTTCFSPCDKDSAIIFTTGLLDLNPPYEYAVGIFNNEIKKPTAQ
jgi:hypothetical protein